MKNNFLDIFKSIKGSFNLIDFAQKPKGKSLPRTRASFKEEYKILNQYKEGSLITSDVIKKLSSLNNIDENQARDVLKNIDSDNIISMKIK